MLPTVMQINLVVVILDCRDGLSSVEGEGGVRGDTWMGDLWFAERKANVSKKNRRPKLI